MRVDQDFADSFVKPVLEVRPPTMTNPSYSVVVYPYMYGQFRIFLCDKRAAGGQGDHGGIVRELDTYRREKLLEVVRRIAESADPEGFCQSLAQPWNCEGPRLRIRLDNKPGDRGTEAS